MNLQTTPRTAAKFHLLTRCGEPVAQPKPLFTGASRGDHTVGKQANGRDQDAINTEEMTETTVDGTALWRGQEVRVHAGGRVIGTGVVDDLTDDGSIVWIVSGRAQPRRVFLKEDAARYTVLPATSIR